MVAWENLWCNTLLAGSYADQAGALACMPCYPGRYTEGVGSDDESDCLPCPVGALRAPQRELGSPRSLFHEHTHHIILTPSCPGYYCPEDRTAAPVPCPDNAICPGGATSYEVCPTLYTNNDDFTVRPRAW